MGSLRSVRSRSTLAPHRSKCPRDATNVRGRGTERRISRRARNPSQPLSGSSLARSLSRSLQRMGDAMADLDAIRLSDRQVREAEREARRSDPRRHRTVRARRGRQEDRRGRPHSRRAGDGGLVRSNERSRRSTLKGPALACALSDGTSTYSPRRGTGGTLSRGSQLTYARDVKRGSNIVQVHLTSWPRAHKAGRSGARTPTAALLAPRPPVAQRGPGAPSRPPCRDAYCE